MLKKYHKDQLARALSDERHDIVIASEISYGEPAIQERVEGITIMAFRGQRAGAALHQLD
jgi:hypothetical protein